MILLRITICLIEFSSSFFLFQRNPAFWYCKTMLLSINSLSPIYWCPRWVSLLAVGWIHLWVYIVYFALLEIGSVPYRKATPGSVLPVDESACFWVRQKLQSLTVECVSMSAFMNNKCESVKILRSPHSFFPHLFCPDEGGRCYLLSPSQPNSQKPEQRDLFSPPLNLVKYFAHYRNLIHVCYCGDCLKIKKCT